MKFSIRDASGCSPSVDPIGVVRRSRLADIRVVSPSTATVLVWVGWILTYLAFFIALSVILAAAALLL